MISLTFFGTHHFGAAMLKALIASGAYHIKAVVCQPDRPVGRKQELIAPPVKELALHHALPVFQPDSLKEQPPDWAESIRADVFVVCQYGLIMPSAILALPRFGTINVHTSLLPKYRGASPIQSALLNGETITGVTIMQMDEKMDHGPVIAQQSLEIDPDDTYETLSKRMEPVAAELLLSTLTKYLNGSLQPKPQDHAQATFCKMFTREDGKIDFNRGAAEIYNQYRGFTPWPGVWTSWNNKRLKLLKICPAENTLCLPPGATKVVSERLFIATGLGSIEVLELQLEGKPPLATIEFLRGYAQFHNTRLG